MAFFKKNPKKDEKKPKKVSAVKAEADTTPVVREPKAKSADFGRLVLGVLISPHVTEKATLSNSMNTYVFKVAKTANKLEVKKAIEGKYGVNVRRVNMLNTKPRQVRLGRTTGVVPGYKKAMATLTHGEKIEVAV